MSPPVTSLPTSPASAAADRRRPRRHEQGGAQARLPRQPLLHPGQVSGARHQDRLLHGAGLRGARPHAAALDQHRGRVHQAGLAHRRVSLRRIPHGAASRQQPHQPRHLRRPRARRWPSSGSTSKSCWRTRTSRAWATAASAASPPASSIRWPRSKCRRWVTASATSSASSSRRSSTAGRWRKPTSGCATAIRGRSRGPNGAAM